MAIDPRLPAAVQLDEEHFRFSLYTEFALSLSPDEADQIVRVGLGRRVPAKRARKQHGAAAYLIDRWMSADRQLLEELLAVAMADLALDTTDGTLADAIVRGVPPYTALYLLCAAGIDPAESLASLDDDRRTAFAARAGAMQELHAGAVLRREHRLERASTATDDLVERRAAQRTRRIGFEADQLRTKAERAEHAIAAAVRREAARRIEAETALGTVDQERDQLRAEVEALRTECADLGAEVRFLRRRLAQVTQPGAVGTGALAGQSVVVIGDPGHGPDYLRVCQELGADEARFLDGYGNPREIRASVRMATLVVFVKAFASHRVWDAVNQAGDVDVIPVPVAGLDALRRSVRQWMDGRTP